jgi:hypothetical protein
LNHRRPGRERRKPEARAQRSCTIRLSWDAISEQSMASRRTARGWSSRRLSRKQMNCELRFVCAIPPTFVMADLLLDFACLLCLGENCRTPHMY